MSRSYVALSSLLNGHCSGALSILDTIGCEMHDVETDEQGVSTDSLKQLLENWPAGKPKPKAFYTVPVRCSIFPTVMAGADGKPSTALTLQA